MSKEIGIKEMTAIKERVLEAFKGPDAMECIEYKKKTRPLFGYGLFIRNDDFVEPCHVGHTIEVTHANWLFNEWTEEWKQDGVTTDVGVLVLLKSKGIAIKKADGTYVYPKLTNRGRAKWTWKKIK